MARSMNVGTIFVSITGNSADFRKAVKSARSEIFKLKRALAPIGSIAKTAGIALAGVGIAGAAMGKKLADDIDVLGKLSKSLRSSVGDLQAFKLAAELEGVDFTKATNGLKKLAVITGDISSGAAYSEVTDEWDKLGLKIEEVANLPATEQFKRITAAIREQIPVAEQLSVASAFFGTRNAADVMRITAETTEQATRIFKEYGIELTNARTKGVEEMNDAMTVLRHDLRGLLAEPRGGLRARRQGVGQADPGGAEAGRRSPRPADPAGGRVPDRGADGGELRGHNVEHRQQGGRDGGGGHGDHAGDRQDHACAGRRRDRSEGVRGGDAVGEDGKRRARPRAGSRGRWPRRRSDDARGRGRPARARGRRVQGAEHGDGDGHDHSGGSRQRDRQACAGKAADGAGGASDGAGPREEREAAAGDHRAGAGLHLAGAGHSRRRAGRSPIWKAGWQTSRGR